MSLWDELQQSAVSSVLEAIALGHRRILLSMPTGLGKTRCAQMLIEHYLRLGKRASLYSNRKMLVEQTSGVMDRNHVEHGIRMAGAFADLDQRFQISSVQTEASRTLRKKSWSLHRADLVVMDEAHLNGGKSAKELVDAHLQNPECVLVGLSATPIDLAHFYDHLILAATTSEGRDCGALVPAHHFGPDEPDLRHIGRVTIGEDISEEQARSAMGRINKNAGAGPDQKLIRLFGSVFEWWEKLNPEHKPTILFAPGVAESLWFAEQFKARGVSAAHIDGDNVWIDGEYYESSRNLRKEVMNGSENGRIDVLCNRFVLREGIDAPWLAHGILATVFGSLQSYLQSGGRLLRSSVGLSSVTIQDHGGNWHRHGSLNIDREWNLTDTTYSISAIREERLRAKEEREPFRCPQCAQILTRTLCPCGFEIDITKRSRPVVQHDGSLKEYHGDIYRPYATRVTPDTARLWRSMYYRARNAGMTFRAAYGLYCHENGYYPPRDLPLMPRGTADWCAKVADVPQSELR